MVREMNSYEMTRIRSDILGLIKYVAQEIRGYCNLPRRQRLAAYWVLLDILSELTWIYRHRGGRI